MAIPNTKLRLATIAIQFAAGVGLLTASYFTTETEWSNKLINATTHQQLITILKCV